MKFACECRLCDGTGSLCPACKMSAVSCPCRGHIITFTCPNCDGTGDEPLEAQDEAYVAGILETSDADALAGRWPKHPRKT